jgi:hypothetical protein
MVTGHKVAYFKTVLPVGKSGDKDGGELFVALAYGIAFIHQYFEAPALFVIE